MSYASATQKTYRSQLRRYIQFCNDYHLNPVPATQETLSSYMAFLARSLSPNSIPGYMNIIRLLHLDAGFDNPLLNNWDLKLIYKGISRTLGQPPQQKAPINPKILLLINNTLDGSDGDIAFWCACLIAYYGFMRKSTLLPSSNRPTLGKYISRDDIKDICLTSFRIIVRNSKTIQFGNRVHSITYANCPDIRLCPVRALLKHVGTSPLKPTSPIFNYIVQGVETHLTQPLFISRLRRGLRAVGIPQNEISGHSFRRGGASLAFAAGMSALDIKRRGDWASNAYERYVHVPESTNLVCASLLANAAASQSGL